MLYLKHVLTNTKNITVSTQNYIFQIYITKHYNSIVKLQHTYICMYIRTCEILRNFSYVPPSSFLARSAVVVAMKCNDNHRLAVVFREFWNVKTCFTSIQINAICFTHRNTNTYTIERTNYNKMQSGLTITNTWKGYTLGQQLLKNTKKQKPKLKIFQIQHLI